MSINKYFSELKNNIKIIGVTGNSGAGKSSVCEILRLYNNNFLISADKIAHEIILPGNIIYNNLIKAFGESILDKNNLNIDRKKLAELAFKNKLETDKLNLIMHPAIIKNIINKINQVCDSKKKYDFIILDAPLLIETNLNKICNEVWLVFANKNLRIKRLLNRTDNSFKSKKEIIQRLKRQISFEQAKKFADIIIYNNGTIEKLKTKIKKILDRN